MVRFRENETNLTAYKFRHIGGAIFTPCLHCVLVLLVVVVGGQSWGAVLPPFTNSGPLTIVSEVFLGGAGDQRGTGIGLLDGQIYLSGTTSNESEGLVAKYATPLLSAANAVWATTWPSTNGQDYFNGLALCTNGILLVGPSYGRTIDSEGGKETKGIVVLFPLTGATGGGFAGATWDRQAPSAPGAFTYGGVEVLVGISLSMENGTNFIYATGYGEISGGTYRTFVSKLGLNATVLWTQTDLAEQVGYASTFSSAIVSCGNKVIIAGITADSGVNRPYLRAYAPDGVLSWTRSSVSQGAFNGAFAVPGGIYAVGTSGSGTNTDFLIEKWDENGSNLWSRVYDRSSSQDVLRGIGSVGARLFAVGYTRGLTAGGSDAVILEVDPGTGDLLSTSLYGGSGDDLLNCIATDGNELYALGETGTLSSLSNEVMLLRLAVPPRVTVQPQHTNILVGQTAVFNIAAEGSGPLSYQWYFEGNALAGQTNPTLMLTDAQEAQQGNYFAVVSGVGGSATSVVAQLTVTSSPMPFPITGIAVAGGSCSIYFPTQPGFLYGLLSKPSLSDPAWELMGEVTGTGSTTVFTVPVTQDSMFFQACVGGPGSWIYSLNQVGYINVPIMTGSNYLANPFQVPPNNRIADVIPFVPDGTVIIKNQSVNTYWSGWGWEDPTMLLPPGEGFFLFNYDTAFVQAFVGEVVSGPPAIIAQPQSQTAPAGLTLALHVTTGLPGPYDFQWYFGPDPLPGATMPSLLIPNVEPAHAGDYYVVVSGGGGAVTSAVASVTVTGAPEPITLSGQSSGGNLTISFAAQLGYEAGLLECSNLNGPWTPATVTPMVIGNVLTYTFPMTEPARYFQAYAGATGNRVYSLNLLGYINVPIITGSNYLANPFQVAPDNRIENVIPAAPDGILVVNKAIQNYYWFGFGWDDPLMTLAPGEGFVLHNFGEGFVLTFVGEVVSVPPTILAQPQSQTVLAGSTLGLHVTTGTPGPYDFQWYFNMDPLLGATSPSLLVSNVQPAHAGEYYVVVSGAGESLTSAVAVVTVTGASLPPQIMMQPRAVTVPAGGRAVFYVGALGEGGLSYQWEYNGASLPGATNWIFVLDGAQTNQAGAYRVLVANPHGDVFSSNAVLKVERLASATGWGNMVAYPLQDPALQITNIAAGGYHNLGLQNDGTVLAWGRNDSGMSAPPAGLSNLVAVAGGGFHSMALRQDGTVLAWGRNSDGQIDVPSGLSSVVAIDAGNRHSLALQGGGTVIAWGNNAYSQCTVPAGLSGVSAVAAGANHNLALLTDGTVVAWGDNASGQSTVPGDVCNVVSIAAGSLHSLALRVDGSLVGWGDSTYGQCTVPPVSNIVAVAAGWFHTLVLQENGTVLAWGRNNLGQAQVPEGLSNVIGIAAGDYYSVALRSDGTLVAWGDNSCGQRALPGRLSHVVSLALGGYHGLAVESGGTMLAWGYNQYGQGTVAEAASNIVSATAGGYHNLALRYDGTVLAWGGNSVGESTIPEGLTNVLTVAAGWYHSLALLQDGTVVAWGWDASGQSTVPAGLSNVVAIAAGWQHSLALQSDGTLLAWGDDASGQSAIPDGLSNVVAIAAGASHSMALREDGTVTVWGDATYGQTELPEGLSNVVAIASGGYHGLALKADGTVVGWGDDGFGQSTAPAGLRNVLAIAANGDNSMALYAPSMDIPLISQHPQSQTVVEGTPVVFQVVATGTAPLRYQWFTDNGSVAGTPWSIDGSIPGATNASLPFAASLNDNSKPIYVVVSNAFGSVTSTVATLTVTPATEVVDGHTLPAGTPVVYVNGVYYSSNVATVPGVPPAQISIHSTLSNAVIFFTLDGSEPDYGDLHVDSFYLTQSAVIRAVAYEGSFTRRVEGEPVFVTVAMAPMITQQPLSLIEQLGGTATFSVSASGTSPLTYQWHFNGVAIAGAVSSTLALVDVMPEHEGFYSVLVSNAHGMAMSATVELTVVTPPIIIAQPSNVSAQLGTNVLFEVMAIGSGPFSYQWRKNGVNILNATNATFLLTNIQVADGGSYDAVVANAGGTILSIEAILTIDVPFVPAGDMFAEAVLLLESSGTIKATNTLATKENGEPDHAGKPGGASVWFKWTPEVGGLAQFDSRGSAFDTLLAVYTGSAVNVLTHITSDEDQGGFLTSDVSFNVAAGVEYRIAVDGFAGAKGEFALNWTFTPAEQLAPVITTQPGSLTVAAGATAAFTVVASGTGLSYQWYYYQELLPQETNTTLVLVNVQLKDVGNYRVRVSSTNATWVQSLPASLEIGPVADVQSVDKFEDQFAVPVSGYLKGRDKAASAASAVISISFGSVDSQTINNTEATTSSGERTCVIGGASRWMLLKPNASGLLVVNTRGSAVDTVLAIFQGTNVLTAVNLGCNDNASVGITWSSLQIPAQAGQVYSVQVDGKNGETGAIKINWALGSLPSFTTPLQNLTNIWPGQTVRLVASPGGAPSPALQWLHNGQALEQATNGELVLSDIQPAQSGTYSLVLSNFFGAITSIVAKLTIASVFVVRVQSSFDSGVEDWIVEGDAESLSYSVAGGNPGGNVTLVGASMGTFCYWVTPGKFLGNQVAAYGGQLVFDLKTSTTSLQADEEDVVLLGSGMKLVFDTAGNPATTWTRYRVPLLAGAGWKRDSLNGPPATQQELLLVLYRLTGLKIRAEYSTARDTIYIDNVALLASTTNQVVWVESRRTAPNEVELAWPVFSGVTFDVETASGVGGTWNMMSVSPVVSEEMNRVTCQVTNELQFFRLRRR